MKNKSEAEKSHPPRRSARLLQLRHQEPVVVGRHSGSTSSRSRIRRIPEIPVELKFGLIIEKGQASRVTICSRNTNRWRKIEFNSHPITSFNTGLCFVKGKLYWAVKSYPEDVMKILGLDLSSGNCGEVEQPGIHENYTINEIGTLRGCLSACYQSTTGIDLWIMQQDTVREYWIKMVLDNTKVVR
ncbi:hypothetical protein ACH5RR_032816 [Cinchona calisaya]|uniref:F-box associated beta-propeller type 1 domain-containing protein n=1 Tax=Cinchona calisaya TaxID=153742 RepID=A0ABD2YJ53_9GENT